MLLDTPDAAVGTCPPDDGTSHTHAPAVGQSFVVVVRPAGAEVRLDGAPLEGSWRTIGAHEVATFPIAGGSHRLESDGARFGALVYGLGRHTSYAYPGGLDLEPILLI